MIFDKIVEENVEFLKKNPQIYFSPGRVNLIGEHIDYLGGNVFPTAINLGTYAFVTKRDDMEFHFLSHNFRQYGEIIVTLEDLEFEEGRNWANYPTGILKYMIDKGLEVTSGLNILIYGTLPNGAGLSSSASLEVLMGVLLCEEFHYNMRMIDIVKLSQEVENNYIGVNCGIMDQFAVGMSVINKAIYLDTKSLEFEYVPLELENYDLVIANTNKKRALADSKYNERRSECDTGLDVINLHGIDIDNICELSVNDFENIHHIFPSKTIKRRVEHAVYENDRTKNAIAYLNEKNIIKFGELMNLSHDSLKNLYEVSCLELDTLVDSFRKHGSIGARMTGAGFGGCMIALVESNHVDEVIKKVKKDYFEIVGYEADFFTCKTSDGTRKLLEEDLV